MAKAKTTTPAASKLIRLAQESRQYLAPCPRCDQTVLIESGTQRALFPVTGAPHDCRLAGALRLALPADRAGILSQLIAIGNAEHEARKGREKAIRLEEAV